MDSFLDQIKSPASIKHLTVEELEVLAWTIRDRIIEVMSKNGGHLASNLGVVELSIALHKVFDSPHDKMIFDTSHQSYTHKILTGRNHLFDTIRQFKGLSGFASPDESNHDFFYAGHAATALSLSLGVAKARDLNHDSFHIIPILGDAAFTCGLTHEALNNIPKDLKNFIIILNDNAMSISKNVGAITEILRRLLPQSTSRKLYHHLEGFFKKSCKCITSDTSKDDEQQDPWNHLIDTAPFFEQYGLNYIGPIDGHDLKALIETLEKIKGRPGPYIIHALTTKGHGMPSAIENPTCYHGARPFEKITGTFLTTSAKATFPKIFGKHLLHLADLNPQLITLTPAMPVGSCLVELMDRYPDRCIDVGIAEGHCVTYAGGIAYDRSKKVVVSIYATFLQRALDNLFQDVCLQKAPVIFALDRSGLAGGDGATHNGIYDIGFLNGMPNLLIAQPRNGQLLKELLTSSLSYDQPIAIRYPNLPTDDSELPLEQKEVGRGEILRQGESIAIISLGHKCETALEIAEILKLEGLNPTVIDPIFIKPLDETIFKQVFQTHSLVVTLEEHSLSSGFGQILNSFAMSHGFSNIQMLNFGIPDIYVEQGSHKQLTKEIGLDAETIAKKIFSCFSVGTLIP